MFARSLSEFLRMVDDSFSASCLAVSIIFFASPFAKFIIFSLRCSICSWDELTRRLFISSVLLLILSRSPSSSDNALIILSTLATCFKLKYSKKLIDIKLSFYKYRWLTGNNLAIYVMLSDWRKMGQNYAYFGKQMNLLFWKLSNNDITSDVQEWGRIRWKLFPAPQLNYQWSAENIANNYRQWVLE